MLEMGWMGSPNVPSFAQEIGHPMDTIYTNIACVSAGSNASRYATSSRSCLLISGAARLATSCLTIRVLLRQREIERGQVAQRMLLHDFPCYEATERLASKPSKTNQNSTTSCIMVGADPGKQHAAPESLEQVAVTGTTPF